MTEAERIEHVRLVFEAYELGKQDGFDQGYTEATRRYVSQNRNRLTGRSVHESIALPQLRQMVAQDTAVNG